MEQTASELAVLLDGQVVGNPEVRIRRLAKIESAGPGSVSFLSNPEYERFLYGTQASVVIVSRDFNSGQLPDNPRRSELMTSSISVRLPQLLMQC